MECISRFPVAQSFCTGFHILYLAFCSFKRYYQTYLNGVVASLHQNKKSLWPLFPLITKVYKIENFKQAKDEVGVLTSYKFKEVTFRRHDPQGKLKEHLHQVGFI